MARGTWRKSRGAAKGLRSAAGRPCQTRRLPLEWRNERLDPMSVAEVARAGDRATSPPKWRQSAVARALPPACSALASTAAKNAALTHAAAALRRDTPRSCLPRTPRTSPR